MPISRSDVLTLLIAAVAAAASMVVWNYGRVDIGMTLREEGGRVVVDEMTPDGNAMRHGFFSGIQIIDLTTVDGGEIERGEPIGTEVGGSVVPSDIAPWEHLGPIEAEIDMYDDEYRLPAEAIASARIQSAVAGEVDPEGHWINAYASIDRGFLEYQLNESIWVMAIWLLLGALVWRLLVHGLAGSFGRQHAFKLGVAVAVPALIWPVVQVGTVAGIAAGYLVPAAVAFVLAWGIAAHHPDRQWVKTGRAAAFVAATLAAILAIRYVTAGIYTDDRGAILVLIGAVAVVPAIVAALAPAYLHRERAQLGSLALVPWAAMTIHGERGPEFGMPLVLLGLLLGWQLLPTARIAAFVEQGAGQVRSRAAVTHVPDAVTPEAAWRDAVMFAVMATVILLPLVFGIGEAWAVVIGIGTAGATFFAIRRGLLGDDWMDAAVPLAAAVSVPVMLAGTYGFEISSPLRAVPTAIAALGVAHVLAVRHTDQVWQTRLFTASFAVALVVVVFSLAHLVIAIPIVGLIALIPGVPVAFADAPREPRATSSRLEALAVAITPGAAATMLVPPVGLVLLGGWIVAVVVWRRFTLAPLLGLAQRTQLQRDLAVAAAETERARLAADLHDDALQQLTMLVRTLDEGGHAKEADEAREIATKLRSVVGDLRLPILDDLGAGAALEWLVERVEPLAGGPVKLERSDATRPPANVELAVFRVAQEALTNAIKHGRPPIAVRYDVRTDGRVTLAIDDAGAGIAAEAAEEAPKAGHFGLANMQQRAEQIGALLDVRRWPAGGTRVALEWRPQ